MFCEDLCTKMKIEMLIMLIRVVLSWWLELNWSKEDKKNEDSHFHGKVEIEGVRDKFRPLGINPRSIKNYISQDNYIFFLRNVSFV